MAESFDPADFDAPPPSGDPQADYRVLLDAMRKAGAEGVAEQSSTLARQIEQEGVTTRKCVLRTPAKNAG